MRNVFFFIRRYFTFISFIVLQAVALWFLFNYNRFHRSKGLGFANEMTGWFNSKYNNVEDYFFLKEENRKISHFNDSLLNLMPSNFMKKDTGSQIINDSLRFDTSGYIRHFVLREATVVYSTVSFQKNYLQLNRGANQGIRDNMGVVSSDGCAVGVVVNVSPNFCQVMSLLHVQNTISASLKKSGEFGTVEWDGNDPRYVFLKRLPKSVEVAKGDTVLTSPYSSTIPPGYMVGTVDEVKVDQVTGMYILRLKTAANFYKLQQVHVTENLQADEQQKLGEETIKKLKNLKTEPR
jgi:rod shape-determining protein MreC